jgi:hypothetical protein
MIIHVEARMLSNWPCKIICGISIIVIVVLFMLTESYQLWISISLMICGIFTLNIVMLFMFTKSYQWWISISLMICGVSILDIIVLFLLTKSYQMWISIYLMNHASWYYIQPCKIRSWMPKKIKNTMFSITRKI